MGNGLLESQDADEPALAHLSACYNL
jgi:hypothetical protein